MDGDEVFIGSDGEEELPTPTTETLLFFCVVCLGDIEPNGMHTTCRGGHTCCRECYQGMVDAGNYQCPTCRDYLSGGPLFLQTSTDTGKMPAFIREQLREIKRETDMAERDLKITRKEHRNVIDAFRKRDYFTRQAAADRVSDYNALCKRLRHLSLAAKTATDYEIKIGVFSGKDFPDVKLPDALLPSKKESTLR